MNVWKERTDGVTPLSSHDESNCSSIRKHRTTRSQSKSRGRHKLEVNPTCEKDNGEQRRDDMVERDMVSGERSDAPYLLLDVLLFVHYHLYLSPFLQPALPLLYLVRIFLRNSTWLRWSVIFLEVFFVSYPLDHQKVYTIAVEIINPRKPTIHQLCQILCIAVQADLQDLCRTGQDWRSSCRSSSQRREPYLLETIPR